MAYNFYPATYQPFQPPTMQTPTFQPQPPHSSGIIWVQGEAGAKAYPVAAGSSLLLMDSESECFYIKSTDASGMPMPLRVFEYTERKQAGVQTPQVDFANYVTQEQFDELKEIVAGLKGEHDGE